MGEAQGAPPPHAEAEQESVERRAFVITGALFLCGLVAAILVAALIMGGDDAGSGATSTTSDCASGDEVCVGEQRELERPGIIPRPDEGQEPEGAGDPGGAAQIAVLVGIVAALAAIGLLLARASRRARRDATPP
jgi:hypothetical protein